MPSPGSDPLEVLDGLPLGLAGEARRWAVALHDGGPRTRARAHATAQSYVRAARPALLAWSARYDRLREVTHDDALACQLTEAMAAGFDPLHLAAVFGISETTAIRYAVNAQQLLGSPH